MQTLTKVDENGQLLKFCYFGTSAVCRSVAKKEKKLTMAVQLSENNFVPCANWARIDNFTMKIEIQPFLHIEFGT